MGQLALRGRCVVLGVLAVGCFVRRAEAAAYSNDLGYLSLTSELGSNMPDGSGVNVAQIEAPLTSNSVGDYFPDTTNSEFVGKTITPRTSPHSTSGHATLVGQYYYGKSTSMAPGITLVDVYNANDWIGAGFLGTGTNYLDATTDRVANHSYIGSGTTNADTLEMLHRMDYLVQHDDYINVVAVNNPKNGGANPLFSAAFNTISVGLTNGQAASGTGTLDALYVSGRAAPDLVVPQSATSWATPTVSSAAALLVETAHDHPGLSSGSFTSSRTGLTLEYGETADVIKAALMAGALRVTHNTASADQITAYTPGHDGVQNGLDDRYGAGQLNIYNSYHILAAGQQGPGSVGNFGFDYNAAASSMVAADYTFTGGAAVQSTLAYNAHVDSTLTASLAHYGLSLYLLNSDDTRTLVGISASTIDSTQNLYFTNLNPTDTYALEVTRSDALGSWDYGLAWDLTPVPEPTHALSLAVLSFGLLSRRRFPREG